MSVSKRSRFNPKQFFSGETFKFIGPGLLITVGFIDPGNWASNVAAGSQFGYSLLFVVTISTVMLIVLQHNAAHLGIASGLCIAEACSMYIRPWPSRLLLSSAFAASICTALAETIGGAVALYILFKLPIKIGAIVIFVVSAVLINTNSYRRLEKIIIGFVSIIGFCFVWQLWLAPVVWPVALKSLVVPSFPRGSLLIIMSVLGAVVMPHNLFLHSEIIQSRGWNKRDESVLKRQLKYEFIDTLFSMIIGWAINGAMIIVAAATFFQSNVRVTELGQAADLLQPLLGGAAKWVFAVALLFAGISSLTTAGMAGGVVGAGFFGKDYDIKENHTRISATLTLLVAAILVLFISSPWNALIVSQAALSAQLPLSIFLLVTLTSNKKIMGQYVNKTGSKIVLWAIGGFVSLLNVLLLISLFVPIF